MYEELYEGGAWLCIEEDDDDALRLEPEEPRTSSSALWDLELALNSPPLRSNTRTVGLFRRTAELFELFAFAPVELLVLEEPLAPSA